MGELGGNWGDISHRSVLQHALDHGQLPSSQYLTQSLSHYSHIHWHRSKSVIEVDSAKSLYCRLWLPFPSNLGYSNFNSCTSFCNSCVSPCRDNTVQYNNRFHEPRRYRQCSAHPDTRGHARRQCTVYSGYTGNVTCIWYKRQLATLIDIFHTTKIISICTYVKLWRMDLTDHELGICRSHRVPY